MIGFNKEKGTKSNSKVRKFCLFLAVIFVLSQASGIKSVSASSKIYIDKIAGNNSNEGTSPETAVKSYRKAKELLKGGGTIYVKVDGEWVIADSTAQSEEDNKDKPKAEVTPAESKENIVTPEVATQPETVNETETMAPTEETEEVVTGPEETPSAEVIPEITQGTEESAETEVILEITQGLGETIGAEVTPEITQMPEVTSEVEATQEAEVTPETVKDKETVSTDKVDTNEIDDTTESSKSEETTDAKGETISTTEGEMITKVEVEEPMPAETLEKVEALTDLVNQVTLMVEGQNDIGNVVGATQAYEELNQEVKDKIPDELYKRLRASQIVAAHSNRMSEGFSVAGDLPWYVEFKVVENEGNGTFDFGETIGAYELTLWNTLTDQPYELDGEVTVTIPVANATKYQNLSVIHYLPDGGHEILKVSRVDGEDAISFTTTSFSPYEIVGNTGDVYNQSGQNDATSQSSDSESSSGNNGSSSNGSGSDNNGGTNSVNSRSPGANTGDANDILLLLGLGALAGTMVGGMVYFKNKRNRL